MDSLPAIDVGSDPRVTGEYVRRIAGDGEALTLVGVVHDHPASSYRVRRVVEELDPEVLALELPPISVPLFEQYAYTDRRPPVFGGEMSVAIQAAAPRRTVGIDRPTVDYFRRLGRCLLRERPAVETLRIVVSNVVETTSHAILCRIAAAVGDRTSLRTEVGSPVPHDSDWSDSPAEQARNERTQVRRSRSFMDAFRAASRSRAARLEDTAREEAMAARLAELREDGPTVAVIGIDHLDPVADRLDPAGDES